MTAEPPAFELTAQRMEQLGIPFALEPNPFMELPTIDDIVEECSTIDDVREYLRPRHEAIKKQMEDPLFNGYEPKSWATAREQLAELRHANPWGVIGLTVEGGWRSSKSEFCAKICMETLTKNKGRRMWGMQWTEQASRERQHSYLYRYIPKAWRPAKGAPKTRGNTHIKYSDGTGFCGEYFVLPNGGDCRFKYYASSLDSLQGSELDVVWLDEEAPPEHLENIEGRLMTRNGFWLLSFTGLNGYSALVGLLQDRARIVKSTTADLLPLYGADHEFLGFETVPLVMFCANKLRRITYFHTAENFYGGWNTLRETLIYKPRREKLAKGYGVVEKRTGAEFTNWKDEVNIMPEAGVASVMASADNYTWYQVMDPAGARNPFLLWAALSAGGQIIIMREWPQEDDYIPNVGREKGVWAISGASDDGERGPGQENFGIGSNGISREVERVETGLATGDATGSRKIPPEKKRIYVRERWMDSRAASAPNQTQGRSQTLIEIYEELKPDADGSVRRLLFEKASGRQTASDGENWKQVIQDKLVANENNGGAPGIIIACHCTNLIFSMRNWTGNDGPSGACLDPIHALKYLVLGDPVWVNPERLLKRQQQKEKKPAGEKEVERWTGYGPQRRAS